MGFTVAIVGRPNVGKSTLFNRLIGDRKAIIDDISGVTRDRQYGEVEWNGKIFNLIDTGGFVPNSKDVFESAISEQVLIAIEEASLIVFMVDCMTGITDLDDKMARILRRGKKQVFVLVNKVDNGNRQLLANEFYALGFEYTFFASSITGSGSGELLDAITALIKVEDKTETENEIPKITIVGQPNVGKSSLLNAFIGKPRNIVTDVAGTTRDSIDTHYKKFGKDFILVDTAGLRKKAKVQENIEFYSTIRAINAIDESDVCMLLIDAQTGIEAQDLKILRTIETKKKGVVILVNKWDLIENKAEKIIEIKEKIISKIAPFTDIPIIFISALEKQRVMQAIDEAIEVYKRRKTKIVTNQLNNIMQEEIEKNSPPSIKGKFVKIKYITQLPTHTPTFAFFCNLPQYIKQPYINYLENRIRANWDFTGVVIKIFMRKK